MGVEVKKGSLGVTTKVRNRQKVLIHLQKKKVTVCLKCIQLLVCPANCCTDSQAVGIYLFNCKSRICISKLLIVGREERCLMQKCIVMPQCNLKLQSEYLLKKNDLKNLLKA